jgi:alpha-mannosidase
MQEELLAGPGNVFEIFEDRPRKYDAWEIDESYERKKEIIQVLVSMKLVEQNNCFITIECVFTYNNTLITQNIMVYEKIKRIDFKTRIDWQERSKLLKVAFPVRVTALTARYEIQEGSLTRPTHQSTSWDRAKFEVLGHSWADLSDENMGVSLLNDCKYGYDIKDNVMRLSLLKSAEYPDINADRGMQEFTYALYSHQQRWNESQLIDLAFDLNNPLTAIKGRIQQDLREIIDFSSSDLSLDAFKQCDKRNGYIVRMHEDKGRRQTLSMHLGTMFSSWCQANLLEEPIEEIHNNKVISISVKPFEIITFIIQ